MAELQDLIDRLKDTKVMWAASAISSKKLKGTDADVLMLGARLQGLEDALDQVVVQIEKLAALSKDENAVVEENSSAAENH